MDKLKFIEFMNSYNTSLELSELSVLKLSLANEEESNQPTYVQFNNRSNSFKDDETWTSVKYENGIVLVTFHELNKEFHKYFTDKYGDDMNFYDFKYKVTMLVDNFKSLNEILVNEHERVIVFA